MSFAARYLPGSAEAEIGGDWYDVIPLRDGKAGVVIGDVVGRGIAAAARMAHLQSAVRAYALEGLRPSVVLERTDAFAQELERRGMATMLYAVLDPEAGDAALRQRRAPAAPDHHARRRGRLRRGPARQPAGHRHLPFLRGERRPARARLGRRCSTPTAWSSVPPCRWPRASMRSPRRPPTSTPSRPSSAGCCRAQVLEGRSGDDIALLAIRLEPLPADRVQLSLPAESRSLATLRRVLGRWLKAAGAGETEIYETLVAVGEACANAIAHAYPAGEAAFEVEATRSGSSSRSRCATSATGAPAAARSAAAA